jgi:serine/threonine protein kinase/Tol biopolymer transport system component
MSEATKRCPYCGEEILEVARKCKHCGEWLEDPPSTTTGTYDTDPETLVRTALAPQYEIQEELGRGGMAVVYRATQSNLGREVALKVLPQGMTHDKKLLKRFHREARSAAQLNHPHIVTIFDEGEVEGVHYMAMEYLEGRDLHDIVKEKGPLPVDQIVEILAPVAEALGYAHERDTVHRDVKSSNVMVTDIGRPVLMDFGIAYASSESRLTQTGTVLGTPEYMSPEQARGNEVDPRSDLYSLGVVLYEALTGELPHSGGHPMSVVYKVLHEGYIPPSEHNPDVPDWMEQIVAKCLAKDADDRYQTGGELAEAMRSKEPGDNIPPIPSGDGAASSDGAPVPAAGSGGGPAETQVFHGEEPPDSDGSPAASGQQKQPQAETATREKKDKKKQSSGPQRQRLHVVRTLEGTADWVNAVAFSPDGQFALSGGSGNTVKLWEVVTGRQVQTFKGLSSQAIAVALSPDGERLVSESSDGVVQLWDVETGDPIRVFENNSEAVLAATFSPDGSYVLSGSGQGGTLEIWDVETGETVRTFDENNEAVFSATFSPDGQYVLTGSGQSGTLQLWDVETGASVRTFDQADWHSTYVFSVAFSPNGEYVLSGSDDMTARLWEVETGDLVRTFDEHSGLVIAVGFSPDGQYVLSGTSDMKVRLWKASNGKLGYVFEGDANGVNAVAFSPDGRYVLSGSKDEDVKLWTP